MSKRTWKSFHAKHKNALCCFVAGVSAKLPGGPRLDKDKKKLPTPYKLFQEWASSNLAHDWTSMKIHGGFVICVLTISDANAIANK